MSQAAVASPSPSLVISRTYPATVERVFKAWTDANQLGQWFAPNDNCTTQATVDLRVGHEYRIAITHKNGDVHTVIGTYHLIEAPHKLVYTWNWENSTAPDTLVTIDFVPRGDSTEVTVTHDKFLDSTSRDQHNQGWTGCMARLDRLFTSAA